VNPYRGRVGRFLSQIWLSADETSNAPICLDHLDPLPRGLYAKLNFGRDL
ncbi:hypothetical protein K525DRAFT_260436, partial [Schizophyllum commune Loenen D]